MPMAGGHNPFLVAFIVSLAPFMEILDTSIANVSLRHIAGDLAASLDESTWVLTSYLVANAIILPASSWLATVLGRKRFYLLCVVLFTASSFLCGIAWSLPSLIVFRLLQGLGGGGMAPAGQSILADLFPPERRGTAFTIFGLAVVVAPTIGPTLGGWITDQYSWHWIFFINLPVGLLSLFLVTAMVGEPPKHLQKRQPFFQALGKFDFVGFALFALCLGAFEVVLDRGQIEDWFGSRFITTFALISAASLIALVPWALTRKYPIVDLRIMVQRQFGISFIVMLVTAGILIGTTQFIPELVQTQLGYTATLAGMTLSPGGAVTLVMMPLVNIAMRTFSPKYVIVFGFVVVGLAMYRFTGLDADITFSYAVVGRIYQAIGLPFVFITVVTASYVGLKPDQTNLASSMINVARNLGGSIGVAVSQTLLAQRQQFHQSRLVESIVPSSLQYQDTIHTVTNYFVGQGSPQYTAKNQAVAWIGQEVTQQAILLSYIDVFWVMAIASFCAIPLALLLRK
ncbi:MAG: DHA2 family efflux MFS transporter permease subunit [Methylobacteriaceae bacterium]|nr:DHA2 family efflux MFS transporter permease subunit [Methylobacteriaceae bacterium]MBV9705692.1 DHA2 family efflux MFS transporter permease subunit [Methylobacteriaceae bacterium]